MDPVLQRVLEATKVKDVTDLVVALQRECGVTWKPVGERENNLATINLGSDPARALVERITNALDAVLERECLERGGLGNIRSPRAAVCEWFGIGEGRLRNIRDIRDPEFQSLADRVRVTLHESERPDRPTVDVRDYGVGIAAEEFRSTVLSLNEDRKLRKLYLAGAFGQGGSTALAYSLYTIVVARPGPSLAGTSSPVGVTIVRYNSGDFQTDKHGVYQYMLDRRTGHPFTFDVSEDDFPRGTLVRHVCMDLGKYHGIMTAPTHSLWYLAHNYLFDPVLPFRIEEQRDNRSKCDVRTVAGNHRLLAKGEHTEYVREAVQTFGSGSITITWWVLSAKGDNAPDRITQYVLPSRPVVVTYNGQKQGELPNTLIKNDLKLPYLERYLIIHVDCDQLDGESRRQLFPTTRESLRDSSILEDLKMLVIETLAGDDELKRLDRDRRERFVQREATETIDHIRRRLASRVRVYAMAAREGASPKALPPRADREEIERAPIVVQEPPSFLDIIGPNPKQVYAGRRFFVRFKTDADASYFRNPDAFLAVVTPPSFGQYTGTANVRDGYGVAYFLVHDDSDIGSGAQIALELRPPRTKSLSSSVAVEVVPLPSGAGAGKGQIPTPNINPHWVRRGDPFWIDFKWDERAVARVLQTDESVEIYVSAENARLNGLTVRAQRAGIAAVEAVKGFYLEHISFHAFLAELNEQKARDEDLRDGVVVVDDAADRLRDRELVRVSETICGIMQSILEMIITQASVAAGDSR